MTQVARKEGAKVPLCYSIAEAMNRHKPNRLCGPPAGGRHAGFTRAELLAIVVILLILSGWLFAGVVRGRDQANHRQCLHNLKRWVLALSDYTADHKGLMPREGHARLIPGTVKPDNWADLAYRANGDVWYNALPPYLHTASASNYSTLLDGGTTRLYREKVWHCPSAKFPRTVVTLPQAYFSLALNSKITLRYETNVSVNSIVIPAQTVAFLDERVSPGDPKMVSFQTDLQLGQPAAWASRFAQRHGDGGNLAFFDGHVEWVLGSSVVETNSGALNRGYAKWPQTDIIWTRDPYVNPNWEDE